MRKTRATTTQIIALGISIYATWFILSGMTTPFQLAMGVVSTAFAVFVALRMELVDEEGIPLIHVTRQIWTYFPWLVAEVVRSNLTLTRIILNPALPISPTIIRFKGLQRSDITRVIHGNSITLTPGTVTLAIVGDEFIVHGVTRGHTDGLAGSDMDRRTADLEPGAGS